MNKDTKKNLIVLAMSTLPINGPRESKFAWKIDDNEGCSYWSQLEPVSTMIREREGSLDRVIILATGDSKEVKEYPGGLRTSAVEYYRKRMNITETETEIIDVEEDDFIPAISNTVNEIRKYWKENNVNLWIDTQGSFRNINLVLNAVITLLELDKIVPSGIYSTNYNGNKKIQKIINQTETYKIFQFVSGINEFTRCGRAEQLTDYYHHTGKTVPEAIEVMEKIAEAIQMCNIDEFDQYLKTLRSIYAVDSGNMKGLLGIFSEQIKRDYGKLLSEDCTGLDIVEWFYRKGFYQQAITYIEAKLPQEWVSRKIISYRIEEEILAKLKKKHEPEENVIIRQMIYQCYKWTHLRYLEKKSSDIKYSDLENLRNGRNQDYQVPDNLHNIEICKNKNEETVGIIDLDIHCNNKDQVMDMLLLYKLLKSERNKFNHMPENTVRADRKHLGNAIDTFIKIGRCVYEDIC